MTFLDTTSAEVQAKLRKVMDEMRAEMRRIVRELRYRDGLILRDAINLSTINNAMRNINQILEKSGFDDLIKEQAKALGDLSAKILEDGGKQGFAAKYSSTSSQAYEMLLAGASRGTLSLQSEVASTLERALLSSVSGTMDKSALLDTLESQLDISTRKAETLIDTTLRAFNRDLSVNYATENGVKWFAYMGPDDSINRDFCNHFVGTRVTLDILKEHENDFGREGQPSPVTVYLGGYNCRHSLVALVDQESIDRYGVGPN